MKLEELVARKDGLQAKFDEQTKIKTEAEQEQFRLQGENRLLVELIEKLSKPKKEESNVTRRTSK